MALGRSSFSTSIGTNAEYAGPPKDCAHPTTKDRVRRCQTWMSLKKINSVSRKEEVICTYCDPSSTRRRSMRSAITPPISENRTMGIWARKLSRPSRNAEPEMLYTSQLCARICIQVPMLEVQEPNQSSRNSRYWKALNTRLSTGFQGKGFSRWMRCRMLPSPSAKNRSRLPCLFMGSPRKPTPAAWSWRCAASKSSTRMARWRMPGSSS